MPDTLCLYKNPNLLRSNLLLFSLSIEKTNYEEDINQKQLQDFYVAKNTFVDNVRKSISV